MLHTHSKKNISKYCAAQAKHVCAPDLACGHHPANSGEWKRATCVTVDAGVAQACVSVEAFRIPKKNIYQQSGCPRRGRGAGGGFFMLFGSDFYLDILSKVSTKTLCCIFSIKIFFSLFLKNSQESRSGRALVRPDHTVQYKWGLHRAAANPTSGTARAPW